MPVRAKPDLESVDFNERPFTLAWELTRSCALACRHCRAAAQPRRHPDELTTAEALRLVEGAELKGRICSLVLDHGGAISIGSVVCRSDAPCHGVVGVTLESGPPKREAGNSDVSATGNSGVRECADHAWPIA